MKIAVSRKRVIKAAKRLRQKAAKTVKAGVVKLDHAQRKGSLDKWKNAIGLGMHAVEIGILASKAIQGRRKRALPARPRKRARAKT